MNYIQKIAEMLGVEVGEHFKLKNKNGDMPFNDYFLMEDGTIRIAAEYGYRETYSELLTDILKGEYEIIKKPWKPQNYEEYWIYDMTTYEPSIEYWFRTSTDLANWKIGNAFRTEEEAETKGKELMEQIMNEYEDF